VTADFPSDKPVPVDLLKAWIDESYRAQAPRRLVEQLEASATRRWRCAGSWELGAAVTTAAGAL
jgi:hypothetical protein